MTINRALWVLTSTALIIILVIGVSLVVYSALAFQDAPKIQKKWFEWKTIEFYTDGADIYHDRSGKKICPVRRIGR